MAALASSRLLAGRASGCLEASAAGVAVDASRKKSRIYLCSTFTPKSLLSLRRTSFHSRSTRRAAASPIQTSGVPGAHGALATEAAAAPTSAAAAAASSVNAFLGNTEDSFLDNISRWIWHKLQPPCPTCKPDMQDWLFWLPEGLHQKLHSCEPLAVLFVRETLLLAIALTVIRYVDKMCYHLFRMWSRYALHDNEALEEKYSRSGFFALAEPTKFFTIILAITRLARVFLPLVRVPFDNVLMGQVRTVAFVGSLTWCLFGWKSCILSSYEGNSKLDKPRLVAIDRLSTTFLVVMGILTAAESVGVPLRSLAAFGGFTGLAVGLASKEVVTNFFGGLVLWLTRPFVIGETIKAGSFSGVVQDIGFFQTKLQGFDRMQITVPNQVFTNMVITNMSRATHRNLEASFALRNEDILRVGAITSKITLMMLQQNTLDTVISKPVCYLKSLGSNNLILELKATAKSMSSAKFYAAQQDLLVKAAAIVINEGAFFGGNAEFPHVQVPLLTGNGSASSADPLSVPASY